MEDITEPKKCAFVLEDDDALRKLFTYVLEEESFEVKAYANATSFKQSIRTQHPAIIIMDMILPDGNGIDICHDLKADPETAQIPIILLSAHSELHILAKGCQAEAYMPKPFDIHEFISSVEKFVN
ncbi:response regulator transcription factor [Pedobacter polaris]|nr:response regulator [Pedobacter polaris]